MRLKLKQVKKYFGNVDFSLINDNGESLGNIDIAYRRMYYSLSATVQIGGKKAIIKPIHMLELILHNPYRDDTFRPIRPFRINGYYSEGWMFEQDINIFKNRKYGLPRLFLDTGKFIIYKAGFGKEGITAAVYKDDTKIATIHKPYKIINDVYDFDMDVNEDYLMEATIMLLQWYLSDYYSVNQMIKSISVENLTTKDEFILSKVM